MSAASRSGLTALAVLAVAALLLRVPSVAQPLGIDQGLFASAARAMSRGAVLYRDVWDQKPPAIFLVYRAALSLFGWRPAAIGWLDIAAAAATTALLFAIARQTADAATGAAAAAIYATLTLPSWMLRYGGFLERSVAETFISVAIGVAAFGVTTLLRKPLSLRGAALLGLGAGAALVFKPNAGVYLPALVCILWCYRSPDLPFVKVTLTVTAAAAVLPLLTVVWIASVGVWDDARVALIDFNRFYVRESLAGRHLVRDFMNAVGFRVKFDPLWSAGAIGALLAAWEFARARRLEIVPALAMAWGAGAALVILMNGAFLFNTYFLQALPPLALLTAWTVLGLGRPRAVHKIAAVAALVVILVPLIRKNFPAKVFDVVRADLQQLRGTGDPAEYLDRFGEYGAKRGYAARANAEVAAYVRAHTRDDETIFQFGINSAEVYFAADRLPAQRFLRVNEFVPATFPAPGFSLEEVVRELTARGPRYLIFEQLHNATPMAIAVDALQQAPELQPLLRQYHREAQIEDYTLYRRRE